MNALEHRFRNPQRDVAAPASSGARPADRNHTRFSFKEPSYQVVAEAPQLSNLLHREMSSGAWRERLGLTNLGFCRHYAFRGVAL
jgi:hypothetical protein